MPTIRDVARQAGVGVATVSRVLNGTGYVKSETRDRIQRAIDELHYTPNEIARNLYFQKSGIVAVLVPELAHPFVAELVNAIEVALCNSGYQAMVCNTFYEENYEQRYLDMLKRHVVDGIIFAAHTSLAISQYQDLDLPILGFDRILGPNIPCISADHKEGGRLAAEVLLHSGCRNVLQFVGAYHGKRSIGPKEWVVTPADQRHIVFQQIMERHGVACHRMLERHAYLSSDDAFRTAAEAFQTHSDIDGIFGTDLFAMACLHYALEHGIRVPQDLKIVAYDGTKVSRFMSPELTTICQPFQALADEAVRTIVQLIQGKAVTEQYITLPVSLHQGRTTDPFMTTNRKDVPQ